MDQREVEARELRAFVELLADDEEQTIVGELKGVARAFVFDLFELGKGAGPDVVNIRRAHLQCRLKTGSHRVQVARILARVVTHPERETHAKHQPEPRNHQRWRIRCEHRRQPQHQNQGSRDWCGCAPSTSSSRLQVADPGLKKASLGVCQRTTGGFECHERSRAPFILENPLVSGERKGGHAQTHVSLRDGRRCANPGRSRRLHA